MADKFCTQCGQRIELEDRFCTYCGAPAAVPEAVSGSGGFSTGTTPGADKSAVSPPRSRKLAKAAAAPKDDDDESEDEAEEEEDDDYDVEDEEHSSHVLTEHDLNYLIVCSYEKAPLDSHALLVREKERGLRWVSASLIQSLKGCKLVACARVYFCIGLENISDFCVDELGRDELSEDAWNKIANREAITEVEVTLIFEPVRHEDMENVPAGKWVRGAGEGGKDRLKAIVHLPIPGSVLKRKLQKHETFLQDLIQELRKRGNRATDTALAEYEKTLGKIAEVTRLVPEGPVDHAYCLCYPDKYATVKLTDELNEQGGAAESAVRAPSAVRAAKMLSMRSALPMKGGPARTTGSRRGSTQGPGHPESHTAKDALSRLKKLFRPDS